MTTINSMLEAIKEGIEEIYCDGEIKKDLTMDNLLSFKNGVSYINNAIAMLQTVLFLDELVKAGKLPKRERDRIIENLAKPNANGYDVYDVPSMVVAELKGTVPCNGKDFGANQRNNIKHDIENLTVGASKNHGKESVTEDLSRYIVLFDCARDAMKIFDTVLEEHKITPVYIETKSIIPSNVKEEKINFDIKK